MKFEDMINRVICGDCLEVMKGIPDNSIDLVLTDPPYNISKTDWDTFNIEFFRKWLILVTKKLKVNTGTLIFFCSHIFVKHLRKICEDELKLIYKMMLIWDFRERNFTPKRNYKCGFDTLLFYVTGEGYTFNRPYFYSKCWNILKFTRVQSNREEGNKKTGQKYHLTQKPFKLMKHLIEIHSNENQIVLDPFLGSGTTAVACKQLKRKFIGIEINPEYCKIARERLRKVPERLDKFVKEAGKG